MSLAAPKVVPTAKRTQPDTGLHLRAPPKGFGLGQDAAAGHDPITPTKPCLKALPGLGLAGSPIPQSESGESIGSATVTPTSAPECETQAAAIVTPPPQPRPSALERKPPFLRKAPSTFAPPESKDDLLPKDELIEQEARARAQVTGLGPPPLVPPPPAKMEELEWNEGAEAGVKDCQDMEGGGDEEDEQTHAEADGEMEDDDDLVDGSALDEAAPEEEEAANGGCKDSIALVATSPYLLPTPAPSKAMVVAPSTSRNTGPTRSPAVPGPSKTPRTNVLACVGGKSSGDLPTIGEETQAESGDLPTIAEETEGDAGADSQDA